MTGVKTSGEAIGVWVFPQVMEKELGHGPNYMWKMEDSLLHIDSASSFSIKEKQLDITRYWHATAVIIKK